MKHYLNIAASFALGMATIGAHAADIEAGQELANAQCAACHGAGGMSAAATFPILAGQHADYIVQSIYDYRDGTRKGDSAAMMVGMVSSLSDEDIKNVAAYFEAQTGLITPVQSAIAE